MKLKKKITHSTTIFPKEAREVVITFKRYILVYPKVKILCAILPIARFCISLGGPP
jgi:hypothetical protein